MISSFLLSSSFFFFFFLQNWRVKKESELPESLLWLVLTVKATDTQTECRTNTSRFAESNLHPYHIKCLLQPSFNPVLGTLQLLDPVWCALQAYLSAQFNSKRIQLACSGTATQHKPKDSKWKGDQKIQFISAFLLQTRILMYTHCSALQQTLLHSSCLSGDLY